METIQPIYLVIGIIIAVFGAGISLGNFRNKNVTRERCEQIQKENYELRCKLEDAFNLRIEKMEGMLMTQIEKINLNVNNSLIRVHIRLDQLLHQENSKEKDL